MKTRSQNKTLVLFSFVMISLAFPVVFAQQGVSKSTSNNSKWNLQWKTALSGTSSTGENGRANLFGFSFDLQSKYRLSQSLQIEVNPIFKYSSGSTQSFDTADNSINKVSINEALIQYRPTSFFVGEAGALNQGKIHSNLLVESSPFPAVRFTLKNDFSKNFIAGIVAQNAIPTSSSLASNTGEQEPVPSLQTLALKTNFTNERIGFRTHIGYFNWNQLPGSIASKSYSLGNDVTIITESEGRWKYQYQGIDSKIEANYEGSSLSLRTGIDYLKNQKAPSKHNSAVYYWGLLEVPSFGDSKIQLISGRFSIQSDATIAYFAPNRFYNTNRNGYHIESKILLPKDGYNFALRYTEADVMSEHPIQMKERNLLFKLETNYVGF